MKKSATVVMVFGLVTAACSGTSPSVLERNGCNVLSEKTLTELRATKCEEVNRQFVTITVDTEKNEIDIRPLKACGEPNGKIEFRFRKADEAQDDVLVVVMPKNPRDRWLNVMDWTGKKSQRDLEIPRDARVGSDHLYTVMTSTGLCEDPMVHIERGNLAPE